MNTVLVLLLNQFAYAHSWVGNLAVFFGDSLGYVYLIGMVIFVLYRTTWTERIGRTGVVIYAFFAGFVARYIIKSLLVVLIHSPRPYVAITDIHALIPPVLGEAYQSFPSGHMLFFAAFSMIIWQHNKTWGWISAIGVILMGIGRVMIGVHYPLDIIAGIGIGMLVGYGLWRIKEKMLG